MLLQLHPHPKSHKAVTINSQLLPAGHFRCWLSLQRALVVFPAGRDHLCNLSPPPQLVPSQLYDAPCRLRGSAYSYALPFLCDCAACCLSQEKIALSKSGGGLGMTIHGGKDKMHLPGDPSIYVTAVIPDHAASRDGRLQVGDKILSVNGLSMENVTHVEAVRALKMSPRIVSLEVCMCSCSGLCHVQSFDGTRAHSCAQAHSHPDGWNPPTPKCTRRHSQHHTQLLYTTVQHAIHNTQLTTRHRQLGRLCQSEPAHTQWVHSSVYLWLITREIRDVVLHCRTGRARSHGTAESVLAQDRVPAGAADT